MVIDWGRRARRPPAITTTIGDRTLAGYVQRPNLSPMGTGSPPPTPDSCSPPPNKPANPTPNSSPASSVNSPPARSPPSCKRSAGGRDHRRPRRPPRTSHLRDAPPPRRHRPPLRASQLTGQPPPGRPRTPARAAARKSEPTLPLVAAPGGSDTIRTQPFTLLTSLFPLPTGVSMTTLLEAPPNPTLRAAADDHVGGPVVVHLVRHP